MKSLLLVCSIVNIPRVPWACLRVLAPRLQMPCPRTPARAALAALVIMCMLVPFLPIFTPHSPADDQSRENFVRPRSGQCPHRPSESSASISHTLCMFVCSRSRRCPREERLPRESACSVSPIALPPSPTALALRPSGTPYQTSVGSIALDIRPACRADRVLLAAGVPPRLAHLPHVPPHTL